MTTTFIKKLTLAILPFMLLCCFAKGQDSVVTVRIDLTKQYQRIDNFAASDAWSCQFIGNWPAAKKDKIADLLFSKDTLANGSPVGIALSMWRFNIGAGSVEQGDKSNIKEEWRRVESFLNADNIYNWQKQAGQIWFLEAAKKRGVNQFIGFINSPPVSLTINGKSYADSGRTNIGPDKYDAYANYLATVIKGVYKISGIKFNYISPVNEPQWKWSDAGQEGSPYLNTEIAGLTRAIDKSFTQNKVSAKILLAEAGSINYLYSPVGKGNKGNQINDFFNPASPDYVGGLAHVSKIIAAHSYFTTSPLAAAIKTRQALADSVAKIPDLSFWQSEYCILGDNEGEINGNKRDLGIDAALYLARVIHTDLTVANASAWQWWLAISPFDYKDGLVYVDKNKTDGNYYASKMLWAMGNYSRFISPGSQRVDAKVSGGQSSKKPLLISAYKNGKSFTVVIINNNAENTSLNLNTGNYKITHARAYVTSSSADLKAEPIANEGSISIQAKSITSITGLIQ